MNMPEVNAMFDIVRTYEAECARCGKSHRSGAANKSNELFIKELEELGWIVGADLDNVFCSKSCKKGAGTAKPKAKKTKSVLCYFCGKKVALLVRSDHRNRRFIYKKHNGKTGGTCQGSHTVAVTKSASGGLRRILSNREAFQ
jgi:hypothetical protein